MTTRRRGGNAGNSIPVVTRRYELRDRTKNAATTSEIDPRTPEPGSQADISVFVRPSVKSAGTERKARTVEQTLRTRGATTKTVTPASDSDSDGSDSSNSSGSGQDENNRQPSFTPNSTFTSSTKRQPSPPSELEYTGGDTLNRPPIGRSFGSGRKLPPQDYTNTGSTNTRQSQSSSEDEEEKAKSKGLLKNERLVPMVQLKKTSHSKEEMSTWNIRQSGEESNLYRSYQQNRRENTQTQPAPSGPPGVFSDDEDERKGNRYQPKMASSFRPPGGGGIKPYTAKKVEPKVNIMKRPTKSFLHCNGTCIKYLVPVLVLLLSATAVLYMSPELVSKMRSQLSFADEPQVKKDLKDDYEKLSSIFTGQSQLMWRRSRRILEQHLENWKKNTEPVIILLTGAQDAEQTLLCLGTRLADIYSSSCSGNYTVISGSDWESGSSEDVKEHIDSNLSASFQGNTRATVLHRLELLPAGSLLILYKYCDHESAVFKNVMLLLTVLLDDATLAKDIPLTDLEEKLREFLIEKVTNPNTKATYDQMDGDKFSGVWSRISHVVLPVFHEENMEQCAKKPN